jgi:hypothetical protein
VTSIRHPKYIPRMRHPLLIALLSSLCALPACASKSPPPATAAGDGHETGASSAECPEELKTASRSQGGACLEPAAIGDAAAKACGQYLQGLGWLSDPGAAKRIGAQTGKVLVCYHAKSQMAVPE